MPPARVAAPGFFGVHVGHGGAPAPRRQTYSYTGIYIQQKYSARTSAGMAGMSAGAASVPANRCIARIPEGAPAQSGKRKRGRRHDEARAAMPSALELPSLPSSSLYIGQSACRNEDGTFEKLTDSYAQSRTELKGSPLAHIVRTTKIHKQRLGAHRGRHAHAQRSPAQSPPCGRRRAASTRRSALCVRATARSSRSTGSGCYAGC
jgi:hypothetical protein